MLFIMPDGRLMYIAGAIAPSLSILAIFMNLKLLLITFIQFIIVNSLPHSCLKGCEAVLGDQPVAQGMGLWGEPPNFNSVALVGKTKAKGHRLIAMQMSS